MVLPSRLMAVGPSRVRSSLTVGPDDGTEAPSRPRDRMPNAVLGVARRALRRWAEGARLGSGFGEGKRVRASSHRTAGPRPDNRRQVGGVAPGGRARFIRCVSRSFVRRFVRSSSFLTARRSTRRARDAFDAGRAIPKGRPPRSAAASAGRRQAPRGRASRR